MHDLYLIVPLLALGGAAAGVLAGLFGIGGGTILVPLLYEVMKYAGLPQEWQMHVALGTSLAIIVPTSIVSYRKHKAKGAADTALLRYWTVPIVLGVLTGTVFATFVSSLILKIIFAVVCTFSALRLLLDAEGVWRLGTEMPEGWPLRAQGAGIGFVSSLMGLGGGVFGTLLMTLYNRPIHQAIATSAGIGVLVSLPGVFGYMLAGLPYTKGFSLWPIGFVAFLPVLLIAPLSALCAPLGVKLAHHFSKRRLELAFAAYLLLIAGRFFISLL